MTNAPASRTVSALDNQPGLLPTPMAPGVQEARPGQQLLQAQQPLAQPTGESLDGCCCPCHNPPTEQTVNFPGSLWSVAAAGMRLRQGFPNQGKRAEAHYTCFILNENEVAV